MRVVVVVVIMIAMGMVVIVGVQRNGLGFADQKPDRRGVEDAP